MDSMAELRDCTIYPRKNSMYVTLYGTTSKTLYVDPADFEGMSERRIIKLLKEMAVEEYPDIDFWEEDFMHAASEIRGDGDEDGED